VVVLLESVVLAEAHVPVGVTAVALLDATTLEEDFALLLDVTTLEEDFALLLDVTTLEEDFALLLDATTLEELFALLELVTELEDGEATGLMPMPLHLTSSIHR
jgi:hypothetical protein